MIQKVFFLLDTLFDTFFIIIFLLNTFKNLDRKMRWLPKMNSMKQELTLQKKFDSLLLYN